MMKKSEILKEKAQMEDNDLKSFGIVCKALREERNENFEEKWLPKFKEKLGDSSCFYDGKKSCFTISGIPNKMGNKIFTIDFYPKANKCFVHNSRKWVKPGLKFLIGQFLND